MKVGDLVNFHTNAWAFKHVEARYANPGIILSVEYSDIKKQRFVSDIVWADGQITREHDSYLHSIKENNNERKE